MYDHGFIPKRDLKGLEEKLNSRFELAVESSDVPEDEEAPVLLSNGTFAASAEGRDRVLWFTGEGGDGPDRHHGGVLCIFVWSDAFRCGIRIYCIFDVLPGT